MEASDDPERRVDVDVQIPPTELASAEKTFEDVTGKNQDEGIQQDSVKCDSVPEQDTPGREQAPNEQVTGLERPIPSGASSTSSTDTAQYLSTPYQEEDPTSTGELVFLDHRKVSPQLATCSKTEKVQVDFKEIKEELCEHYKNIKDSGLNSWTKSAGFKPGCNPARIRTYLSLNNKLNSNRMAFNGCVGCGRIKKSVPKSHIWPKGLLKLAMDVHCPGLNEFILNLRNGKLMGANGPTVKLLCTFCEEFDSTFEQEMHDIYLKLLSEEGSDTICKIVNQKRVLYVLVKILFLGMMINIDVEKELEDEHFKKVFFDLWKFYNFYNDYKGPSPDVRLFIVPSEFDEHILRNMAFTSVVRRDGSTFLYARFDIFHVVIPVNEESRSVFDGYDNCLQQETLDRCDCREKTSYINNIPHDKHLFPEILMKENKDYEQKYSSVPKEDVLFWIEFLKLQPKDQKSIQSSVGETEDTNTELLRKAREISPLSIYKTAEQQIAELEQALKVQTRIRRAAEMESKFYKEKCECSEIEKTNLKHHYQEEIMVRYLFWVVCLFLYLSVVPSTEHTCP